MFWALLWALGGGVSNCTSHCQGPAPTRQGHPSFAPQLLTAGTCDSASGLSWAAAALSAGEQGRVGIDTAEVIFNSQMGGGGKYSLVEATWSHVLHLFPEVPTGNMTQSLVNTSCFGCLPLHLTFPIPFGCFLGSLPK